MKNVQIDNTDAGDIERAITWQFDNAEHLVSIIGMVSSFFKKSTTDFWDDFIEDVENIDTANDFGLSVIGKILDCPRPTVDIDDEQVEISTDFYRRILKARFALLNGNASVKDYTKYLYDVFHGGVSISDGLDMGISFIINENGDLEDEELAVIRQRPDVAFLYPAGVKSSVQASGSVLGFDGQEEDDESDETFVDNFGNASFMWRKNLTKENIATATISGVLDSYVHTGNPITPIPIVSIGSETLVLGSDYTVSYQDNTNVGTGKITISGIGRYYGSKQKEFLIKTSIVSAIITPSQLYFDYDGTQKKPTVVVRIGGVDLVEDVDYTVGYIENIEIGNADIVITGIGEYGGQTYEEFYIVDPDAFYIENDSDSQFPIILSLIKVGSPSDISIETNYGGTSYSEWIADSSGKRSITIPRERRLYIKKTNPSQSEFSLSNESYYKFQCDFEFIASGRLSDLADDGAKFCSLFAGSPITNANIVFGDTTSEDCYRSMFNGCDRLIHCEDLTAETLSVGCYQEMFFDCESLEIAPELPATTLAKRCYVDMFRGCTSLTSAPDLQATTMADVDETYGLGCYAYMFDGCSSLSTPPEISATTLSANCFEYMFYGCTSLSSVPSVISRIENVPEFAYSSMFYGCSSIQNATIAATTIGSGALYAMFGDCSNLSYVEVSFTRWATGMNTAWLRNVKTTGTFKKPEALPAEFGLSRIPEGWTVVNK